MRNPQNLLRVVATALCLAANGLGDVPALLAQAHQHAEVREIEILVEGGYKPNRIEIEEGEHVRLKFVRKEYTACTREVVIPKLGIRRELPPNLPVLIDVPALAPGEYEFKCGMNMIRGTLVVVAHAH